MVIPEWVLLIFVVAPPFFGVIWIYGTWKNWKVFMDPSDVLWFMWLWHFARKHLDNEGMKAFNYFWGILLLTGGIFFSVTFFKRLQTFGYYVLSIFYTNL